jgi:thiol-disulfide isomerase/thioredoxin
MHQLHELKRHMRSLPWHPSPTGVFDLLERSRAWKDAQGAERSTEIRVRFLLLFIFEPTDCSPCLEDLSVLAELHRQVPPQQLEILGIASNTSLQELRDLMDAYGVRFPVLLDEASTAKSVLELKETPWKILCDLTDRRIIFDMGPSRSEVERRFFAMSILRAIGR